VVRRSIQLSYARTANGAELNISDPRRKFNHLLAASCSQGPGGRRDHPETGRGMYTMFPVQLWPGSSTIIPASTPRAARLKASVTQVYGSRQITSLDSGA